MTLFDLFAEKEDMPELVKRKTEEATRVTSRLKEIFDVDFEAIPFDNPISGETGFQLFTFITVKGEDATIDVRLKCYPTAQITHCPDFETFREKFHEASSNRWAIQRHDNPTKSLSGFIVYNMDGRFLYTISSSILWRKLVIEPYMVESIPIKKEDDNGKASS